MHVNRFMSAHLDNMARQNRFKVEIHGPPNEGLRSRGMRCINVAAPSKIITTQQIKQISSGAPNIYPTGVTYTNAVTLTFMLDTTFEDLQFVERWQAMIYDEVWSLHYPDEYHGTMTITQLALDDYPIYSVDLHHAFPTEIGALTFNAGEGGFQTVDIAFVFRTWSSAYTNVPSGILGGLFKKFTRRIATKVKTRVETEIFEKTGSGGIAGEIVGGLLD